VCIHPLVEIKDNFFDDLQNVITSVPFGDLLLAMGDFNARVGCAGNKLWAGMRRCW